MCFLVLALMGCGTRGSDAPVVLTVSVDGAEVARLRAADLRVERPLTEVVPAGARDVELWAQWTARSADGRTMTIRDPAERFDDHDTLLRLDAGRPAVVVVRHHRADQPPHLQAALAKPEEAMIGVKTIAIETLAQAAADAGTTPSPAPRAMAPLVIVVDGAEHAVDAAVLDALAPLPGEGHKAGGWDLRDVLAVAGVSGNPDIVAVGREGSEHFRRADLDRPGAAGSLRRNRRGQLRLAVDGAGGAPLVVHDLQRLEVTSAVTPP